MICLMERWLERRIFWNRFGFVWRNGAKIGFLLELPTMIGAHVSRKPRALTKAGGWAMLGELGCRECKINHQ